MEQGTSKEFKVEVFIAILNNRFNSRLLTGPQIRGCFFPFFLQANITSSKQSTTFFVVVAVLFLIHNLYKGCVQVGIERIPENP